MANPSGHLLSRHARPLGAAVVALALFGAACAHEDAPGVGIQPLEADIVFGVKPAAPKAVPHPPIELPEEAASTDLAPPPPLSKLAPLPKGDCPAAALTAFPEKAVGVRIEGLPAAGLYRWKRTIVTYEPGSLKETSKLEGFETRLLNNVEQAGVDFTYDLVQKFPDGTGASVTYKVVTAPTEQNISPTAGPATVRVGQPDRGISIQTVTALDKSGNTTNSATYTPAVLILPIPVISGEAFNAVGVDPRTGSVLVEQGTVVRRQRVDACGEIVDGWLVEAMETAVQATTQTLNSNVRVRSVFAPQYGGMLISQTVELLDTDGNVTQKQDYSLGQLKPTPLPAGTT